jgi:hypothetical protein
MGDVIGFKRPKPGEKNKGRTLCKSGFHKWEVDKAKPFDTKAGKLVSRYVCSRCGSTKTESR